MVEPLVFLQMMTVLLSFDLTGGKSSLLEDSQCWTKAFHVEALMVVGCPTVSL